MTTITISRTVPAPPERAYAAWIEPERLATWWWPHLLPQRTSPGAASSRGGTT